MNEKLAQLYQATVLEHHEHPRNRGPLAGATHMGERYNPLCGDRVIVHATLDAGTIVAVSFEGDGCAIAMASASLLTTLVARQSREHAQALAAELEKLLANDPTVNAAADRQRLRDLVALEGVRRFPSRRTCATLAWEALTQALESSGA